MQQDKREMEDMLIIITKYNMMMTEEECMWIEMKMNLYNLIDKSEMILDQLFRAEEFRE